MATDFGNNIPPTNASNNRVLSVQDLRQLERDNMIRALEATSWKISGIDGAARMLGMKASTLDSHMKTLGIERSLSR